MPGRELLAQSTLINGRQGLESKFLLQVNDHFYFYFLKDKIKASGFCSPGPIIQSHSSAFTKN